MARQRLGNGGRFRAPRCSAGPRDDGQLVENDRGILDEDAVGHVRAGRQPLDAVARVFERILVRVVLCAREIDVDRHAAEVCQFAARERRADLAGDGGQTDWAPEGLLYFFSLLEAASLSAARAPRSISPSA